MEKDKKTSVNPTGYTEEELQNIYKESQEGFENEPKDYLDWDFIESLAIWGDEAKQVRLANIKEDKAFLDKEKTIPRYSLGHMRKMEIKRQI